MPQTPLGGVGEVAERVEVIKETPPQEAVRTLPSQATPATPGQPPQGGDQLPPQPTLSQEEVAQLANAGITLIRGRWVRSDPAPQGFNRIYVDPQVELARLRGESEGESVMAAVGKDMIQMLNIQSEAIMKKVERLSFFCH